MSKRGFRGPYRGRTRIPGGAVKNRLCLRCGNHFPSAGPQNRVCLRCHDLSQKCPPSELELSAGWPR